MPNWPAPAYYYYMHISLTRVRMLNKARASCSMHTHTRPDGHPLPGEMASILAAFRNQTSQGIFCIRTRSRCDQAEQFAHQSGSITQFVAAGTPINMDGSGLGGSCRKSPCNLSNVLDRSAAFATRNCSRALNIQMARRS